MKETVNQSRRQMTFNLVPNTLRATTAEPVKPMTSKQAKQAHARKQKAVRLSKEERVAMEKEELERIRREGEEQQKENERERVRKKARAIRENNHKKKKLELERRRSAGLPLVDVRPSQPTITSFLRTRKSSENVVQGQEKTLVQETMPVHSTIPMRTVTQTVDPELLDFLEANFESIFPTASQEALELMVQVPKTNALTANTPVGRAPLRDLGEDTINKEQPPKLHDDDWETPDTTQVIDGEKWLKDAQKERAERAVQSQIEQEDSLSMFRPFPVFFG